MYSQHQGLCFVSLLILSKLAVSFEVDKLSWQTCVCVSPDPYVRVCVSASVCVCVCVYLKTITFDILGGIERVKCALCIVNV